MKIHDVLVSELPAQPTNGPVPTLPDTGIPIAEPPAPTFASAVAQCYGDDKTAQSARNAICNRIYQKTGIVIPTRDLDSRSLTEIAAICLDLDI